MVASVQRVMGVGTTFPEQMTANITAYTYTFQVTKYTSILVFLLGPIGLCAMLSAKAFGAAAVCVTGM